MLGIWAAGKTSLVAQYVNQVFSEKYHATLGVKIDTKQVTLDGRSIKLVIWDLASSEGEFSLPNHFLAGASAYILVLDSTRPQSLDYAANLVSEIQGNHGKIPFVVALNKGDLEGQVTLDQVKERLEKDSGCFITSAKTGQNVENLFSTLTHDLLTQAPQT